MALCNMATIVVDKKAGTMTLADKSKVPVVTKVKTLATGRLNSEIIYAIDKNFCRLGVAIDPVEFPVGKWTIIRETPIAYETDALADVESYSILNGCYGNKLGKIKTYGYAVHKCGDDEFMAGCIGVKTLRLGIVVGDTLEVK